MKEEKFVYYPHPDYVEKVENSMDIDENDEENIVEVIKLPKNLQNTKDKSDITDLINENLTKDISKNYKYDFDFYDPISESKLVEIEDENYLVAVPQKKSYSPFKKKAVEEAKNDEETRKRKREEEEERKKKKRKIDNDVEMEEGVYLYVKEKDQDDLLAKGFILSDLTYESLKTEVNKIFPGKEIKGIGKEKGKRVLPIGTDLDVANLEKDDMIIFI